MGMLLPIVFNTLPRALKVPVFSMGAVGMAAALVRSYRSEDDIKLYKNLVRAGAASNKKVVQDLYVEDELRTDLEHNLRMLKLIMQQAPELRMMLLQKYGLESFAHAILQAQQQTVTVEAVPLSSGNIPAIAPSSIDWNKELLRFPTEDIAKLYITETLDLNSARGVLIVAPARVGKTSLLHMMIQYGHQLNSGQADYLVFAGKDNQKYAGIEKDPNRYLFSGHESNIYQSAARLQTIKKELKVETFRRYVIADELNNTNETAKGYDRRNKGANCLLDMQEVSKALITRGSSQGTLFIASTHELRVEPLGFNTAMFDSVSAIVLGRTLGGTPAYGCIEECLSGNNSLIDNSQLRHILYEQFVTYINQPGFENCKDVLCLTNVGGNWRLCTLPDYSKMVKSYQPVYTDGTEELSTISEPTGVLEDDFVIFVEWAKSKKNDGVSDAEIIEMYDRYLQQTATSETIRHVREEYIGKNFKETKNGKPS
jgi:hypothetical protein